MAWHLLNGYIHFVRRARRALILAGLAVAVFILFIDGPDIVTSHEARVAQPARLMAASGWPWDAQSVAVPQVRLVPGTVRLVPDTDQPPLNVNPWLVPVLNGQIRLQKPPLPYWCAAVLFRFFGFHEWSARLIPALLGAIATFFIYDLGRRLFGREVGWCAALIWVSTYAIPEMYRKAMADPYLGFFTLICVWAWVRATSPPEEHFAGQSEKEGSSRRFEGIWLVVFYAAFGFALLAKGPPALVTVLIPLLAYHLCLARRFPTSFGHVVGLIILSLIAMPWPAYVMNHIPHVRELWRYESIGELSDNIENARPWWFYGPQVFYLALPWTPMWIAGWFAPFRRVGVGSHDRRVQVKRVALFPMLWWGASIVFFSFVNLKKNQYLLPAIPGQVLMTAVGLWSTISWARKLRFRGVPGALIMAQALIGVGFAIAAAIMLYRGVNPKTAWLAAIIIAIALLPFAAIRAPKPRWWILLQSVAYSAAIVFFFVLYIRPMENQRSAKQVATEMLALSRQPDRTILVPRLPEEVSVYLPLDLKYGPQAKVLTIIDDSRGVRERARHGTAIPPPNPAAFEKMISDGQVVAVRRLPMETAPGDARWKVYEITVRRTGFAMR